MFTVVSALRHVPKPGYGLAPSRRSNTFSSAYCVKNPSVWWAIMCSLYYDSDVTLNNFQSSNVMWSKLLLLNLQLFSISSFQDYNIFIYLHYSFRYQFINQKFCLMDFKFNFLIFKQTLSNLSNFILYF